MTKDANNSIYIMPIPNAADREAKIREYIPKSVAFKTLTLPALPPVFDLKNDQSDVDMVKDQLFKATPEGEVNVVFCIDQGQSSNNQCMIIVDKRIEEVAVMVEDQVEDQIAEDGLDTTDTAK